MAKGSNEIVLDLETQRSFSEVGGRNIHLMKVSVAGIYLYETGTFRVFTENEILELLTIMESASLVVGFNTKRFDYLVLEPYFKKSLKNIPSLDILEEVERVLGHRVRLEDIATATLGEGKTGSGLDALRYFRQGQMDKLVQYCKDDVRLTRDLYEYGKRHAHLLYRSGRGVGVIPISW